MTVRFDDLSVSWLGYATVRIEGPDGFVVYVDPGRYDVLDGYDARDGDLVLVTHDHHYDSDAIEQVAADDATVVAFEGVDAARIDRDVTPVADLPFDTERVGEEAHTAVGRADVWSVPAFNDPEGTHAKAEGSVSHPRGLGCGFLVSLSGTKLFWPGDTDAHEGFERLSVDLFLANVGGSVVMDRHEAADLAETLDPRLVLPVHYDTIDLLSADAEAFAADVAARGVPVVLEDPAERPV
jgi:L-ascorbate metabolism protein UlaG (beta-lactamase superfamily)